MDKRTDVTLGSKSCVVVLELKRTKNAPGPAFLTKAHEQLSGHIQTSLNVEALSKKRPVTRFVVVLFKNGAKYIVEKAQSMSRSKEQKLDVEIDNWYFR